jgi:hypothetical protein
MTGDDPRYDAHETRAAELVKQWDETWQKELPRGCRWVWDYIRGFPVPRLEKFPLPKLLKLGEPVLRAAPLWHYHYGMPGRNLKELLAWPYLHRLEQLALSPPLPKDWAGRVAGCTNLRNVTDLELINCRVSGADLKTVLDAFTGRRLREMRFDPADDEALRVVATHPVAAGLRELSFDASHTPARVARLTTGPARTALIGFTWRKSEMGDAGLRTLLRWPALAGLRTLILPRAGVTDAGVNALASCRAVANLRGLWLPENAIGIEGAEALAASRHLARLKEISLYRNPLVGRSQRTRKLLRDRFGEGFYL